MPLTEQFRDCEPHPASVPRKPRWWLAWSVFAIVIVLLVLPCWQVTYWIGATRLELLISVVDAESGAPVAGASIAVFQGPFELGVGMPPPVPDETDATNQFLTTDENGRAETICRFTAYGHTGTFSDYGHLADYGRVRLGDRYVRVSADGFEPTLIRLGEQFAEVRDVHDESPIELLITLQRSTENASSRPIPRPP